MEPDQEVFDHNKIKIPKGVEHESKNPKKAGTQITGKSYIVVVGTKTPANSSVVWWVGGGRYFCCADKKDVEFIG